MMEITTPLAKTGIAADLAALSKPIRVCIIGVGEMGTDLIFAISNMQNMEIAIIVDRNLKSYRQAFKIVGIDENKAAICGSENDLHLAHSENKIAIVKTAALAFANKNVDVVIEATGRPNAGAEYGIAAIENKKHVVMMNVEADVTIGSYLQRRAKEMGVVYTIGAGDEPTAIMELYNFVMALGYSVVAAGKGKNNEFKTDAVPNEYIEQAKQRNMNPRMLVEFVDGSKTMVEMGCLANATGLTPDVAGMHGPDCNLENLHKVFCPKSEGGILQNKFCVDYTLGKNVAPGVFVIGEVRHARALERMQDLHFGAGPYYTFFRPFHLTSLEVPLSVARAVLYGKADMQPLEKPVCEVCALAKKDLQVGEELDKIGETSYRSWLMKKSDAKQQNAVPVGLLEGGKVTKPIKKGELINYDSVAIIESTKLFELRKLQEGAYE